MDYYICLVLFSVLFLGASTLSSEEKVCRGFENLPMFHHLHLEKLKGKNCTHIMGNLIINHVPRDTDLSYLESIKEVYGFVLITKNFARSIRLPNLRIIRGDQAFNMYGVMHSLVVLSNMGLEELDLSGLRLIMRHNVKFFANQELCWAPYTVQWADIFEWGSMQKLDIDPITQPTSCSKQGKASSSGQSERSLCHASCPLYKGKKFCWGPSPNLCQKLFKCQQRQCTPGNWCYVDEHTGREECCHEECTAGCSDRSNKDCSACRRYENGASCVMHCPPATVYNKTTYQHQLNPEYKLALGSLCVKQCPMELLRDGDTCVTQCGRPNTYAQDRQCVPCPRGVCPKVCKWNHVSKEKHLSRSSLRKLVNCTVLEGNLYLNTQSFDSTENPDEAVRWGDLQNLRTLRKVRGGVLVSTGTHAPWLTNLTFLENVQVIRGDDADKVGLTVHTSYHLNFLGLHGLKEVSQHKIQVTNNQRLCYTDQLPGAGITTQETIEVYDNAAKKDCANEGRVCHSACAPRSGCWGPGPLQCVACRSFRAGDRLCVQDCDATPAFFLPPTPTPVVTRNASYGERWCAPCHSECSLQPQGCSGPGPDQCNGPCRHFKDGPFCRASCPTEKYADPLTNACRDCSPACPRSVKLPDQPLCSGPREMFGRDGCKLCAKVVLDRSLERIEQCLPERQACPEGYYTKLLDMSQPSDTDALMSIPAVRVWLSNYTEIEFRIGRMCAPCHQLCHTCTDASTHNCKLCTAFRYKGECVAQCPPEHSYVSPEHNLKIVNNQSAVDQGWSDEKLCRPCHSECRGGCDGPTEANCLHCRNVRVQLNTSQWICNVSCPDWLPHSVHDVTGEITCSVTPYSRLQSDSSWTHISIILIPTAILVPAVILLVWCVRRRYGRRGKRRALDAEDLDRALKEESVPLNCSPAPPNMATLLLVTEAQIWRGPVIGSGAFGTVYRGVWTPDKLIQEGVSRASPLKVAVAIKVLSDCSDPSTSRELLEEAKVMASVSHPCCLRLLAVCLTAQPQLVTQFMPQGCLLDYVRCWRSSLGSRTLLLWASQIAHGMSYLESRGIIHRDLAARNVLVQNVRQVRITDFGLAKVLDTNEQEYRARGGRMPIKWLALECIQDRIFSHKSDVWAYGVTLWEIFTFGQRPYENVKANDLSALLERGERLPQPTISSLDVYTVLVTCWLLDVESRPTFQELVEKFNKMCEDPGRYLVIEGDLYQKSQSVPPSPVDPLEGLVAEDYTMETSFNHDPSILASPEGEDGYLQPISTRGDSHATDSSSGWPPFSPASASSCSNPSCPGNCAQCTKHPYINQYLGSAGGSSQDDTAPRAASPSWSGHEARYAKDPCDGSIGSSPSPIGSRSSRVGTNASVRGLPTLSGPNLPSVPGPVLNDLYFSTDRPPRPPPPIRSRSEGHDADQSRLALRSNKSLS